MPSFFIVTAWPGEYGPNVVMHLPCENSSRNRAQNASAAAVKMVGQWREFNQQAPLSLCGQATVSQLAIIGVWLLGGVLALIGALCYAELATAWPDAGGSYFFITRAFGKTLGQHQLTQARIADMALDVDASALLVYRAAWERDRGAARVTREAAMAKLFATEAAQRVVDSAVQLFGGRGVLVGETVERLYREVRALRIYEGTSEIQRLVIASQVLPREEPS